MNTRRAYLPEALTSLAARKFGLLVVTSALLATTMGTLAGTGASAARTEGTDVRHSRAQGRPEPPTAAAPRRDQTLPNLDARAVALPSTATPEPELGKMHAIKP